MRYLHEADFSVIPPSRSSSLRRREMQQEQDALEMQETHRILPRMPSRPTCDPLNFGPVPALPQDFCQFGTIHAPPPQKPPRNYPSLPKSTLERQRALQKPMRPQRSFEREAEAILPTAPTRENGTTENDRKALRRKSYMEPPISPRVLVIFGCRALRSDEKTAPCVEISIHRRPVASLIDSGSDVSIIDARLFEELRANPDPLRRPIYLGKAAPARGVGHHQLELLGNSIVSLGHRQTEILLAVRIMANCPYPLILGRDFIREFGEGKFFYNEPKGEIVIGQHRFKWLEDTGIRAPMHARRIATEHNYDMKPAKLMRQIQRSQSSAQKRRQLHD